MHKPKYDPETYHPQQSYAAKQLSRYDMQVAGVVVFVVAMTVFFVVALVMMLFGGEAATQAQAQTAKVEHRSAVTAEQRNKMAELTQPLPKPAVRAEDVNDDIAGLHARENLMLENYTWANRDQAKVRIPIHRAMVLLAQRGLPTASAVSSAPLLTGDSKVAVAAPLTNGYAPTEDEQARTQAQH